jgi:hypothetical protein
VKYDAHQTYERNIQLTKAKRKRSGVGAVSATGLAEQSTSRSAVPQTILRSCLGGDEKGRIKHQRMISLTPEIS